MEGRVDTNFHYLQWLAKQYRSKAVPVPMRLQSQDWWASLLLKIGGCGMLCKQSWVSEVITLPKYTPLPAAKPWVMGVANLRGEPLPLVDLNIFFKAKTTSQQRRVLITRNGEQLLGLVVEGVNGMYRVMPSDSFEAMACPLEACQAFASETLTIRRQRYWNLDLDKLLQDKTFLAVAKPTAAVAHI